MEDLESIGTKKRPGHAVTPHSDMEPLLQVRDLTTSFRTDFGTVHAVNGISYDLDSGKALALVGESGSGKTVSVLSLLGLIPSPPGRVEKGQAFFEGRDLLTLPPSELRRLSGHRVSMVFQDPMTSLNPVLSVGYQIREVLQRHLKMDRRGARKRSVELLEMVGIPNARSRLRSFPHQFSGGQRQRIMVAMALACDPALLIADEPTTALDVTVQAQITSLVKQLQQQLGMSIIWISHDLALVAGLVDEICVMYAGFIIEQASTEDLFRRPRHPYTLGLLRSLPTWNRPVGKRLYQIPGTPPDLRQEFLACPFAPRCEFASDRCLQENPPLLPAAQGHHVACWHSDQVFAQEVLDAAD